MYSNKTSKRVMAILLAALFIMTIGFATLQQRLSITGTSKIDSVWDVRIIGITSTPTGSATNHSDPSFTATTASFNTDLVNPGDTMVYDVTVKNNGSLDAILSNITKTDSNNPAISFTYTGIENNSILKAGESAILKVTVKYNESVTTQPSTTSSSLTLTLNYRQNNPNNADYVNTSTAGDYVTETAEASSTSGLVADDDGNYVYKGSSPENYITFNGEEAGWRILSIENDGTIKIIRNTSIGNMSWDAKGTRSSSTSTYCTKASDYGCNAWAATENLGLAADANYVQYKPNGNKNSDTTKFEGTVTQDASLNMYLNTTYYNSLTDEAKGQIVSHDFYVSTPGTSADTEGIATDKQQIKDYVWNGKVALITAIEYMKGSTNASCSSLKSATSNGGNNCGTNNWLKTGNYEWTLSPNVNSYRNYVWNVHSDGNLHGNIANYTNGVRPVLYLSSDIHLEGKGTSDEPYTITAG